MPKLASVIPPVARQISVQAVIKAVLEHGSITRTQLAAITGLSKQTMSEVVRDLEADGWLRVGGQAIGSVGRRAAIYEFEETACYVLGVDLGGSNLRAALATLNGRVVAEANEETDRRGGGFVVEQVGALVARLVAEAGIERGRLKNGVVAVSGILQRSTGAVLAASNIPGIHDIDFAGLMEKRLGIPLSIENAVDMATRGEQWRGGAQGIENFVVIAHGAGIGMGAVVEGKLRKGRKGAVGEIAFLPIGANPFDPRRFEAGTLESEVGAEAMVSKFEAFGGFPGATVRDIFDSLEKDYGPALAVVDETARSVALAIASVVSVLDPELVIMGGQIGVHPQMIARLQHLVPRCSPLETAIQPSPLGFRAQLVGAVGTASEITYEQNFGVSVPHPVRKLADNGLPSLTDASIKTAS